MMVTANRATSDTIGEILSDIQAQGVRATQIIDRHRTMLRSRQLDKKPIDLHAVINESLALVAHDLSARQIEATVHLPSNPCVISGDQVLLQQVLVNLMMNAMDAMAETPPAQRHLTISTDVRAADVDVSVRDTGTGLPAHIIEHAVHALRHDETARPRDRPHDRAVDRRRAWWHDRRPQQSRRGRDIHGHAAPQRTDRRCRQGRRRSLQSSRHNASPGLTWVSAAIPLHVDSAFRPVRAIMTPARHRRGQTRAYA